MSTPKIIHIYQLGGAAKLAAELAEVRAQQLEREASRLRGQAIQAIVADLCISDGTPVELRVRGDQWELVEYELPDGGAAEGTA